MDSPETWGMIWLAVAVLFGIGEILIAGSFFLLPFGVGGLAASVAGFAGAPPWASTLVFLIVSLAAFAALRPVARRMDANIPNPVGTGANRLIGHTGVVINVVNNTEDAGEVRIGSEEWRAESLEGLILAVGQPVEVVEVRGTRVVVRPTATV